MTEQDAHFVALYLSVLFGALAAYRIHIGGLFENGAMLRLGMFLLAAWRAFGDLHEVTDWFNWYDVVHSHALRNIVSEIIIALALAADIWRLHRRQRVGMRTQRLIEGVKNETQKGGL